MPSSQAVGRGSAAPGAPDPPARRRWLMWSIPALIFLVAFFERGPGPRWRGLRTEGRGELAMGSPANAVAWLVNKLAERGKGLRAGQLVMTGTLTPITPIEPGSTYVAVFSTLGRVEKSFA